MEPENKALEEFPGLSQEDLEEVEGLYDQYLFYSATNSGRQIWTTCCHEYTHLKGEKGQHTGTHRQVIQCPFCGEAVEVICLGRMRSGKSS